MKARLYSLASLYVAKAMFPKLKLKTLFVVVGVLAVLVAFWVRNSTRFGWSTDCTWSSAAPLPGYSTGLTRYRNWLTQHSFQKCDVPEFAGLEEQPTNTQWFQSQKYPDVFVVTSGDQQHVRGNVVVRVNDLFFHFRATEEELRKYTDYVSGELHKLWHPSMGSQ